jgi:hypothetical protein
VNLTELLSLCDRKFCIAGEWGALVRWINKMESYVGHYNPYRGKPVKWMPGCWTKEK